MIMLDNKLANSFDSTPGPLLDSRPPCCMLCDRDSERERDRKKERKKARKEGRKERRKERKKARNKETKKARQACRQTDSEKRRSHSMP